MLGRRPACALLSLGTFRFSELGEVQLLHNVEIKLGVPPS
jgi:hypothetical protein